jgi:exodeoxyribonuclease VII large subunit
MGQAEIERRRTIERLEADGLLDVQKELPSPQLPYKLAVISAKDAAGFGDFKRQLLENEYGFAFEVDLFEATMQGPTAPDSICDAIARVECAEEKYDAALIIRGGGSALDLACFDDYGLCVSIAQCPVPVYTAIGHDKDYHVADMVAHEFVKTPTALAAAFVDAVASEDEAVSTRGVRLRMAFSARIAAMEAKLDVIASRIHSSDPRNVLSRGYALVVGEDGRIVKSASSLGRGENIKILFEDGQIEATTK